MQQPRSAPEPGDDSTRILLGLQGRMLFAPCIELALVRRMPLDEERRQDKGQLTGRVMRFMPTNGLVCR